MIVIGQDQDNAPGDPAGFQYAESFVGSISGVNLWNTVLPQDQILLMSSECERGIGNVFKWAEFKNIQKFHGGVILEEPSSCKA